MQYTKDIFSKLELNFKFKIKKAKVKNIENFYLKLVILISILVLTIDYYIVKQFIDLVCKT